MIWIKADERLRGDSGNCSRRGRAMTGGEITEPERAVGKVKDMPLSGQALLRHPIDLVAEGMWKIATGESCPECWEMLPEQQKNWWRNCATAAVKEWMTAAKDADHWGPGGAQQQAV